MMTRICDYQDCGANGVKLTTFFISANHLGTRRDFCDEHTARLLEAVGVEPQETVPKQTATV